MHAAQHVETTPREEGTAAPTLMTLKKYLPCIGTSLAQLNYLVESRLPWKGYVNEDHCCC